MSDPTYPPFDPNAVCPKCGHEDVGTAHYEAGRGPSMAASYVFEPERLHRTCRRCHFDWPEAVLTPEATRG